jgi:hypothetical protein
MVHRVQNSLNVPKTINTKVTVLLDSFRLFRVSSSDLNHFAREETVLKIIAREKDHGYGSYGIIEDFAGCLAPASEIAGHSGLTSGHVFFFFFFFVIESIILLLT